MYYHEHDWTNEDIVKLFNIISTPARRGTLGIVDSDSILPPSVTVIETSESITMQSIRCMVMETQARASIEGTKFLGALSQGDHTNISTLCSRIFDNNFVRVEFICHFFSKVKIGFQTYATSTSRLLCSCHVQAYKFTANASDESRVPSVGVGIAEEYVTVQVYLASEAEPQSISFACICWLQSVPLSDRARLPPPVKVWGSPGRSSWTPTGCIMTQVIVTPHDCNPQLHSDSDIQLVVPLSIHLCY